MPKVSFVLPAYKRRFLHEAIASILAQTYRDFELVVVDDCSPQHLKEVVDFFHDARLTYHRNETNIGGNKGLVAAWARAMTYARGEWCVLASDDDVYAPDYLSEMIRLSEKYPKVDIVHCRNCEIDAAGNVFGIGGPRSEYESGIQMAYNSSVLRIHQRMADLMFRKSAYDRLGFSEYPLAWYTDNDTAIRYAWENGAACSPRILFKFRCSGENISVLGGDVVAKANAGVLFLERMDHLFQDPHFQDEDDNTLLNFLKTELPIAVREIFRGNLEALSFWQFCSFLKQSHISRTTKKLYLRSRICSWLNIRRYLPGWKGGRW